MCYRDKNNTELDINDVIEKDGQRYIIRSIKSYPCATVAIAENIIDNSVETFHLRDIVKIL
jgi:hypothetical protein